MIIKTDKFPQKYPLNNQKSYLLWTSDGVLKTETGLVLFVKKLSWKKWKTVFK